MRGAALVWLLARAVRKQAAMEDPDAPAMVSADERSRRIFDRARDLARDGREDQEAVNELRALAGRRRRSLRRAEQLSRLDGHHLERRSANNIHRLLKAALTGTAVEAVSVQDAERFAALEHLFRESYPSAEVWADLVAREPGLEELADDVRRGRYGRKEDDDLTSANLDDPDWRRRRAENAALHLELMERVKHYVGPLGTSADPVLRSRAARSVATFYLDQLRPDEPPG